MYLSDDILVEHYITDIKRMASHPHAEVRMLTARCISILYLKNRPLFYKRNFKATLQALLADGAAPVVVSALKAVGTVEAFESIVPAEAVVAVGTGFYRRGDSNGLRYALNILKHKKMNAGIRELVQRSLMSNDIAVFYLSARMLLESGFPAQAVYDTAVGFMNSSPEQLCNLLVFIHSLIEDVECDIFDYFIYGCCNGVDSSQNNATLHRINVAKAMILARKYKYLDQKSQDLIVANLVRALDSPCLHTEILEILIRNNLPLHSIVSQIRPSDHIIRCISRNLKLVTGDWVEVVSGILMATKETTVPEVYVGLVSCFCSEIPRLIFRFEDERYASHLIRMFVTMMRRGIITAAQCRTYLKNIQRRHEMLVRVAVVLDHLETVDPEDIVCWASKEGEIKDESWKEIDFVVRADSAGDLAAEPASEPTAESTRITQLPFFIDFANLKGLLDIDMGKLVFTVDILEGDMTIKYAVGTAPNGTPLRHEDQILKEGRYALFDVTDVFFNREYTIEIGSQRFHGVLDLATLVKPLSCTFGQFEEEFSKAKAAATVGTDVFGSLRLHKVDFQRYSGVVVGHKVLLKSNGEAYDVKGDEYIRGLLIKE